MATVALLRPRRNPRRASIAAAALAAVLLATGCGAGDDSSAEPPVVDATSTEGADDAVEAFTGSAAPPSASDGEATEDGVEPWAMASPDEHSQVGELVDGFPTDLLPVPADAVLLVTSAVPVGDADVQEVSLNLRTQATPLAVIELYRDTLVAAGFTESSSPHQQADLAAESVFTRSGGDELVSIGVLDIDGGRTVTIGGRLHTGS